MNSTRPDPTKWQENRGVNPDRWKPSKPVNVLPFDDPESSRIVPKSGTRTFVASARYTPLRILRLNVSPESCTDFRILSIKIDRCSLTLDGEIPASLFSTVTCEDCAQKRVERLVGFAWPIVRLGHTAVVIVKNYGPERPFHAAFEVEEVDEAIAP